MNRIRQLWNSRLIQWLLFWAASYWLTLNLFSLSEEIQILDYIYTFLFHIPMLYAVHVHDFFLFSHLLLNRKYVLYLISIPILLFSTYYMYLFAFNSVATWFFSDYFFVAVYSWLELTGFALIYMIASTMLTISISWFKQQQDMASIAQLEEENKRAELRILRAQINPHFLFNSLNIIYNEASKKSEQAPELILKLSEMLRYVVDKLDQERTSLQEEIQYLQNYISFHRNRLNYPASIHFEMEGDFSKTEIIPLVLITFVENCFKHGNHDKGEIVVRIIKSNSGIHFYCRNKIHAENIGEKNQAGTGIQNAKRRLELAYGDKHQLEVTNTDSFFTVNLKLMLT